MNTKKNKLFGEHYNQFSLSKTIRFKLNPLRETLRHIKEKGLVSTDEERAREYQRIKEILNRYHEEFILESLEQLTLSKENLEDYAEAYKELKTLSKKEANYSKLEKKLEDSEKKLRVEVSKCFQKNEKWKNLFSQELLKTDLPNWMKNHPEYDESDLKRVKNFQRWTSYFTGFNENRKNIYKNEDQSTAIAHRIVHINLPKFIDNILKWEKLKEFEIDLGDIKENLADQLTFEVDYDTGLFEKAVFDLPQVFSLLNFNNYLTQKGIEQFNQIIGGISDKAGDKKRQGLNEKINLHHQQQKKNQEKDGFNLKNLKMTEFHKQILCTPDTASFRIEAIEDDRQLIDSIVQLTKEIFSPTEESETSIAIRLVELFAKLNSDEVNTAEVYLKGDSKTLTQISQKLFGDYGAIERALEKQAEIEFPATSKNGKPSNAILKKREDFVEKTPMFNLQYLNDLMTDAHRDHSDWVGKGVITYFSEMKQSLKDELTLVEKAQKMYAEVKSVLEQKYLEGEVSLTNSDKETTQKVMRIKNYLDSLNALFHFVKLLEMVSNEQTKKDEKQSVVVSKDEGFYTEFDFLFQRLKSIVDLYNKTRNYITQKPFNEDKFKINFENVTLAKGWDKNKETDNTAILLMKAERYYLAIMDKKHNKLFSDKLPVSTSDNYQKIDYKLLPGPNKMLPKVFFASSNIGHYAPNEEIKRIRNTSSHTKSGTPQKGFDKADFNLSDCRKMIDFFKQALTIHPEWSSDFDFHFSPTNQYQDISQFYKEVTDQGYSLKKREVDTAYIHELVEEGKLYLFEIYNKDFAKGSDGMPNLHTLYWKQLFSPDNLKNVVYKLDGEAELFYRKSSLKKEVTHPKSVPILNKQFKPNSIGEEAWEKPHTIDSEVVLLINLHFKKQGKWQDLVTLKKRLVEILQKGYQSEEETVEPIFKEISDAAVSDLIENYLKNTSTRTIDLIKNKRYTEDQFSFHVGITQNFKAKNRNNINLEMNQTIQAKEKEVQILSIDRGERNLVYYTLLNRKGEILKQGNLNEINGVDYHAKLDELERNRTKARKSWQKIEKIKDLKKGYLSHVTHKIMRLAFDHNAVIVMEDLNFGFKRGRYKIEKQIYQNLEKMIIDKSNYMVFKDIPIQDFGGLLKAGQLSPKFESFQKMGKQMGQNFFLAAYHTSKICPTTGFVNLLYPKYENMTKSKKWFALWDSIRYNAAEDYFEFGADYDTFGAKSYSGKPKWTICSYGTRLENQRDKNNYWQSVEVDITEELKACFKGVEIDFSRGTDLKETILAQDDTLFFKQLTRLLRLTLQMRNSKTGTEIDYLISPVKDSRGNFFDSRKVTDQDGLPQDSDANGAYHIGLKFLLVLDRIIAWDGENLKNLDLTITNEQWYSFAQKHAEKRMKK